MYYKIGILHNFLFFPTQSVTSRYKHTSNIIINCEENIEIRLLQLLS